MWNAPGVIGGKNWFDLSGRGMEGNSYSDIEPL